MQQGPIGVFDSGYGGLTILKELVKELPNHDFIYMGDNARAPYGNRSFDTVYQYTWQAVQWFFKQGCPLVILACNTASAKALRTIQQKNLPNGFADKRVLGVLRPTTETIGNYSKTGHIGILGTAGTVNSNSYVIEIGKFFPQVNVFQQACPMWVSLIENNEHEKAGADYFVKEYLDDLFAKSNKIDTVLLACTHYPLLMQKIQAILKKEVQIIAQGALVAKSLKNYLQRHPEMDNLCSKNDQKTFFTTDDCDLFNKQASPFFGENVVSKPVLLT